MKRSFFQAAVVSILLYGCTTWTLTKRQEKKLDGNYTRMLPAILNRSWWQHPTKHQLYGHLLSITKTIQVRRTRHAGHCWWSRDELIMDELKQDDQLEHTNSSYVRIRHIAQKTCQKWWMIGKSGDRGSGISVHDMMMMNVVLLHKLLQQSIPTLGGEEVLFLVHASDFFVIDALWTEALPYWKSILLHIDNSLPLRGMNHFASSHNLLLFVHHREIVICFPEDEKAPQIIRDPPPVCLLCNSLLKK